VPHFRTLASQQFRGGGIHLPALRAAHGPFFANGRPAAWGLPPTSFASKDGKLAKRWVVPQDEATKAQYVSGLPTFGDRFPNDPPAQRLGFLAIRCSPGHDIGLTAAFTGEVRFEMTFGSGLQLDRSSVHFSSGLKYHLVEGLIDERQGTSF
jgi:hypothetical protein